MICLLKERCVVAYDIPLHSPVLSATLLTLSITLLSTTATAAINAGITINSEWGYSTEKNRTEKLETTIKPEIEIDLSRDIKLTAIGRIRGDIKKHIDSDSSTDNELREFYIETSVGRSFLTMGKQQIVWGKADGLKVLDVVNPQEWREFILDDFDNSRIPLWAINSEIPIADLTLQLLWLPDQRYHEYAQNNDNYAFTSPLLVPQSPPSQRNAPTERFRTLTGGHAFRPSGMVGISL